MNMGKVLIKRMGTFSGNLQYLFYCYFVLFTIMWMYIKEVFGQALKNQSYVSGK